MSRRYVPDPDAVVTALAGRMDAADRQLRVVDERLTGIATDVAALGRGIAALTAQIHDLADNGGQAHGEDPDDEPDEAVEPQRDWMTVTDSALAAEWLTDLTAWTRHVLIRHAAEPTAPCWPLHPDVVAELLALQSDRNSAYAGDRPTPVSEWLARWLPTARQRIQDVLAACVAERGHVENGRAHDATGLDPTTVAAWWVTDRDTPSTTAFDLPVL